MPAVRGRSRRISFQTGRYPRGRKPGPPKVLTGTCVACHAEDVVVVRRYKVRLCLRCAGLDP